MTLSDGKVITATEGHPFRTVEGWRDAVLLKKGDILILTGSDGKPSTIQVDEIRYETKVLTTYNLEVANAHTFFVGEDAVLVHNCTPKIAQNKVRKGQGPRDIKRIDAPEESVPGSQWHAHQTKEVDGRNPALNQDGTPHDGMPNFSNKTRKWLKEHGWNTD